MSKMFSGSRFAILAFASLLSGAANAETFGLTGGTSYVLSPATFSLAIPGVTPGVTSIQYFDNSNAASGGLNVTTNSLPVFLRFTYMGADAGNTNSADSQFAWNNTAIFTNTTTAVGATFVDSFGSPPLSGNPSLVPFLFRTLGEFTGGVTQTATNGGPIDLATNAPPSLLAIGFYLASPTVAYAFFEDGSADKDFDDMVVKIEAFPDGVNPEVPLPPAILLFGTALAGIGLLGRNRRRKQASDVAFN